MPSPLYNTDVFESLPKAENRAAQAYLLVYEAPASAPVASPEQTAAKLDESSTSGASAVTTAVAEPPPQPEQGADASNSSFVWKFLINPASLKYSRSAQYSDTQTLAAKVQDLQYFLTSGETLEISNVLFDSWNDGKSLQPLIDGLNRLLEAKVEEGKFAPPILSLIWGSKRFSPCVLTQISWDEAAWLGGDPASLQLSLTLKKLPEDRGRGTAQPTTLVGSTANTDSPATPTENSEGKPRMPLTDAQAAEASKYAKQYLNQQLSKFSPDVQQLIRSNSYLLLTNRETGDVTMLGKGGTAIGNVLRWNGETSDAAAQLLSGTSTTVPLAANATLPATVSIADLEKAAVAEATPPVPSLSMTR